MGADLCCARIPRGAQQMPSSIAIALQHLVGEKSQLDAEIDAEIGRMYQDANLDARATLSMDEVNTLTAKLKERGWKLPVSLSAFDFDRSGELDSQEFSMAIRAAIHDRHKHLMLLLDGTEDRKQSAKHAFDQIDADGGGKLSAVELNPLLAGLASQLDEPMPSPQEIEDTLKKFDRNGDGELDLDEFTKLYTDTVCRLFFMPREKIKFAESLEPSS
eukprot:TRINITY_DN96701_c0_g1_i1.p1 TRINITY_DN96701_c0_g1~~TRINITY_DN96701_c0_g1_i1.p1  ORF type:complete len:228 (+),score=44.73 TRINITY_DN96701_c0_g1_i1:36-686(+)